MSSTPETRSGWLRPPRLRAGDRVRIVAPSGPIPRRALEAGARELARLGLRVEWDEGIFERHLFFAGSDSRRRAEWDAAWSDSTSAGIIAARGGSGASRLLPWASLDAARRRPRVFSGFSDMTFLHGALSSRRMVSFYGPMVAWDLARGDGAPGGYDAALFRRLLLEGAPGGTLAPPGAETLCPGTAEGRLAGGCLSLLSACAGTPEAPDHEGALVILEDEKETPYRIDRFLHHLRRSGAFAGARGIVLGEFPECESEAPETTTVRDVLADFFSDFPGPVVWRFPIGHTRGVNLTIPLGTWARLDGDSGRLDLMEEACVEET
jgi:muramoyltetrapeptide carboxypeptidase